MLPRVTTAPARKREHAKASGRGKEVVVLHLPFQTDGIQAHVFDIPVQPTPQIKSQPQENLSGLCACTHGCECVGVGGVGGGGGGGGGGSHTRTRSPGVVL